MEKPVAPEPIAVDIASLVVVLPGGKQVPIRDLRVIVAPAALVTRPDEVSQGDNAREQGDRVAKRLSEIRKGSTR